MRIGIPRVLNLYSTAPWFRTYFEAIGIPKQGVVFSDATTEEMWVEGGKYGSIDPCYPSKVAQAHIHHLLFHAHAPEDKKPLKYIFFPILTHVNNFVTDTMDNASCPIVAGAPDVMKAAFTKEVDFFATRGIEFLDPARVVRRADAHGAAHVRDVRPAPRHHRGRERLRLQGGVEGAQTIFDKDVEAKGRAILETVEAEDRVAILMIGRPYHSDPGLNHGIPEEFQVLGYPILSVRSIPKDREYLDRYYKEELEKGIIKSPLELNHVWPENYSVNSAQKVWAASFAAHHPNVVVLDLSSFKCGHDAPTYGLIDAIIEKSKTPYAALHDIDANKPSGSIKIRVKTYAHALKLHEERLEDAGKRNRELVVRARPEARRAPVAPQGAARGAQPERPRHRGAARRAARAARRRTRPPSLRPSCPKGVIQLGKKTADGRRSRLAGLREQS